MNQQMQIRRAVALQADQFYADAERLGKAAAKALGGRRRAQMTGLENLVNSAMKVSDVMDLIKKQTGRHEDWRRQNLGRDLLSFIDQNLRQRRNRICSASDLQIALDTLEAQQVYLLLVREFIHQVVVQYEYMVGEGG